LADREPAQDFFLKRASTRLAMASAVVTSETVTSSAPAALAAKAVLR